MRIGNSPEETVDLPQCNAVPTSNPDAPQTALLYEGSGETLGQTNDFRRLPEIDGARFQRGACHVLCSCSARFRSMRVWTHF